MFITSQSQQIEKGLYHKHVAIDCVFFQLITNVVDFRLQRVDSVKHLVVGGKCKAAEGVSVVMRVVCSAGACTHHRVST